MVLPSVRAWHRTGWLKEAHWFSLQPNGPRRMQLDDLPLTLRHLALPPEQLAAYARTKEKLWADIHGIESPRFDAEDFRFYARYNWFASDAFMELVPNLDLAYVHDFQLMQVGALVGLAAPTVLRWHVPFVPQRIPRYTRNFLAKAMEDFDTVIVSTRRDLEGLVRVGFRGTARQLYPHVDTRDWPDVHANEIQFLEHEWNLGPDDALVLCVARMDPIKRQDLALRALARLAHKHPRLKLALVGNGSFSGARNGGLGLSKAQRWTQQLQDLVREFHLEDRVVFAHWVPDELVAAAYARATVVVLPSDTEGFGLTVLEGWRYGTPAVVSSGAGVSEVTQDGLNGRVFPAGDDERMATLLDRFLSRGEDREEMGRTARASLAAFDAPKAAAAEAQILGQAIEAYGEG